MVEATLSSVLSRRQEFLLFQGRQLISEYLKPVKGLTKKVRNFTLDVYQ